MALRCTRKLLQRIGLPETPLPKPSDTVLGDWYANFYDARPRPVVICLNERTLLAIILQFHDPESLIPRFRGAALDLLTRIGVPGDGIGAERRAMARIAIGPTANRRVLGCLNEAAFAISHEFDSMHERYLGEHALYLSRFIYSTTQYRPPHELAHELFRAAGAGGGRRIEARQH